MYSLKMADGTTVPVSYCGVSVDAPTLLWIDASVGFNEALALFADTNKTKEMVFVYGDMERYYYHYTQINVINRVSDTQTKLCMRRVENV